jgi:predicted lysophospholipase L1 biosynthesis ABC-type transport system permease subunit
MSFQQASCDSSFAETASSVDEHNLTVLRTAFNTVTLMRDRENLQDVSELVEHLATLMESLRLR